MPNKPKSRRIPGFFPRGSAPTNPTTVADRVGALGCAIAALPAALERFREVATALGPDVTAKAEE
jgi:hypothetical protein